MKSRICAHLILFATLFFSGCSTLPLFQTPEQRQEAVVRKIDVTEEELIERSREMTAAINDLSGLAFERTDLEPTSIEQLIEILAEEDERVEGSPIQRIDAEALLERFETEREDLIRDMENVQRSNTSLLERINHLERENRSLSYELNRESKKNILDHFWSWIRSFSLATIITTAILFIVFGPAAIPIIFSFVVFFINRVPSIIGFLGIVSKAAFDSVVRGVQDVRTKIKSFPPDKIFTRDEVQMLIDFSLEKYADDKTRLIVSRRKQALKLKK